MRPSPPKASDTGEVILASTVSITAPEGSGSLVGVPPACPVRDACACGLLAVRVRRTPTLKRAISMAARIRCTGSTPYLDWQLGKKVLATILDACPLVTLF